MTRILKVGIVGCGEITQISHLPFLLELPNYEISAICDISPKVLEYIGEKYQIHNRYTDFNELVKQKDLDVVLVANKNHANPAIAAMHNGKHVMVEKPIAFNLNQANEMIHAAKANKVKLMVGYMKRFDPAFQMMTGLLPEIEKIHLIRVHDFAGTYEINQEIYDIVRATDIDKQELKRLIAQDQSDMMADIGIDLVDQQDAHDIMIHLCIHDINMIHRLFGLPDKILRAERFDSNFIAAIMQYNNGTNMMWESGNLVTLVDWDEQITVFGSNKVLEIKFPFPYLKYAPTTLNIRENESKCAVNRQIVASYDEAYKREWRHFYSCIVNDRQPFTSAVEARDDLEFAVELTKTAAKV